MSDKSDALVTYDHGLGSFAHNNRDVLPGEPLRHETERSLSREEFEKARSPQNTGQEQDRANLRANPQGHAPEQAPVLKPDLPYSEAVDREAFQMRQSKEALAAQTTQPAKDQAREEFMAERKAVSLEKSKSRDH